MNDMNYSISLLTTTGVIATLISILFAIAALVIANRRKKHHPQVPLPAAHIPPEVAAGKPVPPRREFPARQRCAAASICPNHCPQ